jgi:hypothetical protein
LRPADYLERRQRIPKLLAASACNRWCHGSSIPLQILPDFAPLRRYARQAHIERGFDGHFTWKSRYFC